VRIAYFGLPLGACLLAVDGHELCCAVISPVPAPGLRRLRRLIGEERVVVAAEASRDVLEAEVTRRLGEAQPDLCVSWYWTRRMGVAWLEAARLGALGAHPSLLPRHRGPNPFYWAIDAGDVETGVSVHRLDEAYDTGAILDVVRVPVGTRDAWQLARTLDAPGLRLLRRTVKRLARGEHVPERSQDERYATWAPEPEGDALRVDFSWSTERVLRRVRALSPIPGVALELRGLRLFVTRAEATADFPRVLRPGEAARWTDRIVVRTGDGAIALTRVVVDDDAEEPRVLDAGELVDAFDAVEPGDDPS
jgi:methionyl-tRNA formyltransferase